MEILLCKLLSNLNEKYCGHHVYLVELSTNGARLWFHKFHCVLLILLDIQMHQIKNSRISKQWGSLFIVIFFYCVCTSNCQRDFDYRDEYLLRSGGNVRTDYSENPRGKRIGNIRINFILGGIIYCVHINIIAFIFLSIFSRAHSAYQAT